MLTTEPCAAHLGLLVLREDGAHAGEQQVGHVAPQLVRQHAEVGHGHVDVGLAERDDLEQDEKDDILCIIFCSAVASTQENMLADVKNLPK